MVEVGVTDLRVESNWELRGKEANVQRKYTVGEFRSRLRERENLG